MDRLIHFLGALIVGAVGIAMWTDLQGQSRPETHTIFHDAEPLLPENGRLGGQYPGDPPTLVFSLERGPKPLSSLELFSDGRYLVQGLDYTLREDGKVEIIDPGKAPRKTLIGHYRTEEREGK